MLAPLLHVRVRCGAVRCGAVQSAVCRWSPLFAASYALCVDFGCRGPSVRRAPRAKRWNP